MNPIGLRQNRPSPAAIGEIEAFPIEQWKHDFKTAGAAKMDFIEWNYQESHATSLESEEQVSAIRQLMKSRKLPIRSIHADYFQTHVLTYPDGRPSHGAIQKLESLLNSAKLLGARHIVLPFIDSSSISRQIQFETLILVLQKIAPRAENRGVELHLETDLAPSQFAELLHAIEHPFVRASHDIGNSLALGHSPSEEILAYGSFLGSVHVCDHTHEGFPVPLGMGEADFKTMFRLLKEIGFQGSFTLEDVGEEKLSATDRIIRSREFVERHLQ